jgi:multidrug efflux system membrane fusion protein
MFNFASWIAWLCRIGLSACLAIFLIGCSSSASNTPQPTGGRGGRGQQGQVVPVAIAKAELHDLPIVLTGLGSIEAFNTVTIKSRIDGQLVHVAFKEGQQVRKGDLLAVIDPRPYEVQLGQMQANLFKDQAALKDAALNLERFQALFKEGVISKQQLDTQGSQAGQLEGAVRADQAQIDTVKLNLIYTRITAPVSGRIGLRLVDVGNIVHASDPNGLLVITQLQPIAALFTLPEDNLPNISRYMKNGSLQVEAYSRDDQTKIATGKLTTIDNQIDPATGTGKLKAVFENLDSSLWPNQFVNVHLLLEVRKNNIVVPAAAIQRGPQGTYVFTVKPDNTAEMRPVSVSLTVGNFAAVDRGLAVGEPVVTDGQDKLQPGSHVEARGGNGSGAPRQKANQNSESVKE